MGKTAAIGAYFPGAGHQGAAYVFAFNGAASTRQAELTAADDCGWKEAGAFSRQCWETREGLYPARCKQKRPGTSTVTEVRIEAVANAPDGATQGTQTSKAANEECRDGGEVGRGC